MSWETAIASLGAAIIGALIPWFLSRRGKPSRIVADTAVITDASGHVITTLRAELDRINNELEESRVETRDLRRELEKRPTKQDLQTHIDRLENQLRRLGETPVNGIGPR